MTNYEKESIKISGARQNNLKGFDLELPLNKMIVVTGVSGSGKSSLAFDTIYAEGQRRYVETFSSYARQFLDRMDRPKVDKIEGMPPAIAIDQTNPVRTSRSTVGTMTELNDHLKLLFARASYLTCRACGKRISKDTPESIFRSLLTLAANQSVLITFTIAVPENFRKHEIIGLLSTQGYTRIHSETETSIEVIQDRTTITEENRSRIVEDIEVSLRLGKGVITVYVFDNGAQRALRFSEGLHCPDCNIHYKEPQPGTFSFNSPIGACDSCRGFGRIIGVDFNLVIPDSSKTLKGGAVKPWQTPSYHECQEEMETFAKRKGIPLDIPWAKLTAKQKQWVIDGEGKWEDGKWYGVTRFFEWLETKSYKMHIRVLLSKYRGYYTCNSCGGSRLKPDALLWKIGEPAGLSIHDCMMLPISKSLDFFNSLDLPKPFDEAAEQVLSEIRTRLRYLVDVGLGYLTLDRQSRTLSGGEVQRINLTTALGTSLVNALFVLDEPSIGLHSRDIGQLIKILHKLRDAGNSLIIVEHDPEVIRAADYVLDMGPGPGEHGGEVVYFGEMESMLNAESSITARYLTGEKNVYKKVQLPRLKQKSCLEIIGASEHNLKNIDVTIPLEQLVCITGVSGSGKSTLIQDVCYNGLRQIMGKPAECPGKFSEIRGYEDFTDVILVDQTAIGKTTRSNPASYVGVFDLIRKLFSSQSLAIQRGYTNGTFSFNSGTGRCPSCSGNGFELVEMQFLSDVYLRCPECNGKRFRSEILEIKIESKLHGEKSVKSISDVLDLTVDDACEFFSDRKSILALLKPLKDVGLSYMKLGQPLPTLSGGEAQRLKLAAYLAQTASSKEDKFLFLFDEPTTGLHFADIAVLMEAFQALVTAGHSVVIIEHNLDVIKGADWIIEIGPEGGEGGGEIVFCGTPDEIITCKNSHTGSALKRYDKIISNKVISLPSVINNENHNSITQIAMRQAREHNLKNIDVNIPRDAFTVITGVSGSGKSTIAFDILFAEGQRRYLESLNAYARQFVQPASKPDVDSVTGVPPTVAIEQRTSRGGRKSTVATVTEIYHFLRLLFVKLGTQYCPDCEIPIEPQTKDSVIAEILKSYKGKTVEVFAPLVINRKGIYNDLAKWAFSKGFQNLRVDQRLLSTQKWPKLDRFKEHSIDLPIGTINVSAMNEKQLRECIENALEHGKGNLYVEVEVKGTRSSRIFSTSRSCPRCQRSFEELDPRLFSFNSKHGWCPQCFGTGLEISGFDENQTGEEIVWNEWFEGSVKVCKSCNGNRLRKDALSVRLKGKTISDYAALPVSDASSVFEKMVWNEREAIIARDIINELKSRLQFLNYVGLDYLTLDRAAPTLSGGEAQRIRLASQLGSNLRGVCYILDEPTIGLHSRDNEKLLDTLILLKEKGNSIVVVEHDEDTIRKADYIIDLGPGGGSSGGKVIAEGTMQQIMKDKNSITGKYLKNPLLHDKKRRSINSSEVISIKNASLHNLKSIDIDIPLGRFVCITGVSGSGKSTLVRDILYDNLKNLLSGETKQVFGCEKISGWEKVKRILEVDQRPIGKTPRSCPSTYVGFWDDIRKLFAKTPEALIRGYDASRFSFNLDKGRCPSCQGQGVKKIEMSFLPDVAVQCEECGGQRFTRETLEIQFKGKTIADILNMSIDDGVEFFSAHPKIHGALVLLKDVGLGYLTLGQQSPTLSGGEAQRIKLVAELDKANQAVNSRRVVVSAPKNHTVYVLDEPTVGLHMADIDLLIKVLHKLVDSGNSVIIIEHNLDVVAEADHVIDLGPEGGAGGGMIVAQGTPEKIAKIKTSYTGMYLKPYIERGKKISS